MQYTKKIYKKFSKRSYNSFILGCDIGGTNANLGIFGIRRGMPELLVSFHFKSNELSGLHHAINESLNYIKKNYGLDVKKAGIGVAGVVSPKKDYANLTNVRWNISNAVLLKKTTLKKILLVNDFEAVGYGINMLAEKDIAVVKKAPKVPKAPILVIGAGTGLGKTMLLYDEHYKSYVPIPSEAGNSDFAAQNKNDLDLIDFIKKYRKIKQSISYGHILSGQGLDNIYMFLRKKGLFKETSYTKEIDKSKNQAELISRYRKTDATCKAAFEIFKIIYARFAKNFALDCLAFGGIYVAGGIAPKNAEIFDNDFVKAFEQSHQLKNVLKKIPVYLILNCDVGLLGAGFAGAKYL